MPVVNVYLSEGILDEIKQEGERLERSNSKLMQYAWKAYKKKIDQTEKKDEKIS